MTREEQPDHHAHERVKHFRVLSHPTLHCLPPLVESVRLFWKTVASYCPLGASGDARRKLVSGQAPPLLVLEPPAELPLAADGLQIERAPERVLLDALGARKDGLLASVLRQAQCVGVSSSREPEHYHRIGTDEGRRAEHDEAT